MVIINALGDEDCPEHINKILRDWVEEQGVGELVGHYVCHDVCMFFDESSHEAYEKCPLRAWLKEQKIPEDKCMVYIDW
jgi:hypothetical protein